MRFEDVIQVASSILEGAGVIAMVGGAVVAAVVVARSAHTRGLRASVATFRQDLGRAILLGLELLVGADILRTVAEIPTLRKVAILAAIVGIRTFLSFTLEVELEGRWPWQRGVTARESGARGRAGCPPAGR